MKLYLQCGTTKLKIVGRRHSGGIVLEIVEEKLKSLIGELITHSQDFIIGLILLESHTLYADYDDHIYVFSTNESQEILDKLS